VHYHNVQTSRAFDAWAEDTGALSNALADAEELLRLASTRIEELERIITAPWYFLMYFKIKQGLGLV